MFWPCCFILFESLRMRILRWIPFMFAQTFVLGFLRVVSVDLFATLEKRDVSNACSLQTFSMCFTGVFNVCYRRVECGALQTFSMCVTYVGMCDTDANELSLTLRQR